MPTLGDVRLADRDGGEILLEVGGTTTGPQSGPNNATFESAYTVTKGTGQFSNVKGGSGDAAFELTDRTRGRGRLGLRGVPQRDPEALRPIGAAAIPGPTTRRADLGTATKGLED